MWPVNQPAMAFFIDYCFTQWRMGPSGPTGLDRAVVLEDIKRLRLSQEEEDNLYTKVREIERAALRRLSEMAKQAQTTQK